MIKVWAPRKQNPTIISDIEDKEYRSIKNAVFNKHHENGDS
jgi:hypothetical protein